MNKVNVKKLLFLVMVILLVLPGIVFASTGTSSSIIKSVYFKDVAGNMVFVDYKGAIDQSMSDDHVLYNAIKEHVGVAELKGLPLFLETNTGKLIDYGKAMNDNLFRLEDILNNVKYEVTGPIIFTHELKVVDGVAVIVEIPVIVPVELVSINSVDDITVEYGTSRSEAIDLLQNTTTIIDSNEETHRVKLDWTINNYDGNVAGKYRAKGTFDLPSGIKNTAGLDLEVHAYVTVKGEVQLPKIVKITPVNDISVDFGTTLSEAIELLKSTTTIEDSNGDTHTVDLDWTIEDYNGAQEGKYTATATFSLPAGVTNTDGMKLEVEAIVKVKPEVVEGWPIQVEEVFVGKSQITGHTYANINIKDEFLSVVEGVYLDGKLTEHMSEQPSQWRALVGDDTTVESLRGRIRVEPEIPVIVEDFEAKIDKDQYSIDEEIRLIGMASEDGVALEDLDVTIKVVGEDGVVVVEQLVTKEDGKFSYVFKMPLDSIEGKYEITIKGQEPLNKTINLEFTLTN